MDQGEVAEAARKRIVEADPPPPAPWHFKLLMVGVVGYLGWRLIDGIVWLVERAF